jgi:glycosyltransferase involved in cell wall biosynthesis
MISLIIPALNEEVSVRRTVEAAGAVLTDAGVRPFEIIVVDDGSQDLTLQQATKAGARVIRHPHNAGYGRSLKDGIRAASFDTIVIIDADGTYPAGSIPALLEEYGKGFDMVVGARRGKHYEGSFGKILLRFVLKMIVEFTCGRTIPDINSGLRIFSKATILPFFPRLCDTFSFTTSLTLAYFMCGRFVSYVPIDYDERAGKSKVRLLRDSLRTIQFIVEAILYYNPIKIFLLFSGFLVVVSAASFGVALAFHILFGYILGVGSLFLSILMFGMGLIAILLKQIMHNSIVETGTESNYRSTLSE